MKCHFKNSKFFTIINQFIKFGLVGISNTLISLIIYYFLVYMHFHYIIANSIGFLVSVVNAFYWNSKYVFKNDEINSGLALLKTLLSYGITFLLSTGLLFIMINYLKISHLIAPIINLIVTVPLNFILNKLWAFK